MKVRRQIHRSGAHALEDVDWDDYHPHLKDMADNGEIHRGIGVNLPDDLHRFVHDGSKPVHERAKALLDHVAGMRNGSSDHRVGLGMHWSLRNGVAEDFGEKSAGHYAGTNAGKQDAHDFSWGRTPGEEPDYDEIEQHLHEDHGIHPHDQPEYEHLSTLHTHLHKGSPPLKGQQELFDASRYADSERSEHAQMAPQGEPDYAHSKPGTAVVLHTGIPAREDIAEHTYGNRDSGGEIYHPEGHGEAEVPIHSGTSIPVTGISWKPVHEFDQEPDEEPEYTHHRFDDDGKNYRHAKTATVLNTQIERLNTGDQIRTPTGQTAEVHKTRPHETDSSLMYLDTDMGTSTVKRGTDFQVVPRNSQQQELPDTGNPMGGGNSAELPGAGRTPGGSPDASAAGQNSTCPNCGNSGTLHLQGGMYVCSVCGFSVNAKGSPGNLMFTDQPHGYLPGRRKPGEVPTAHVWASKYDTTSSHSQIARRARQVLGGEQ